MSMISLFHIKKRKELIWLDHEDLDYGFLHIKKLLEIYDTDENTPFSCEIKPKFKILIVCHPFFQSIL